MSQDRKWFSRQLAKGGIAAEYAILGHNNACDTYNGDENHPDFWRLVRDSANVIQETEPSWSKKHHKRQVFLPDGRPVHKSNFK